MQPRKFSTNASAITATVVPDVQEEYAPWFVA